MALFTPDTGLQWKLQTLRGSTNLTVHLYKNDYTPVAGSTLANFTPCTFPGYGLLAANFGAVGINGAGEAEMTSALLTFTQTAASVSTVYGYFVTNGAGDQLVFAERFATPVNLNLAGDTIRLQIVDRLGRA